LEFNSNLMGVDAPADKQVTFNQPVGDLPTISDSKGEWKFLGWFTATSGGTQYTAETVYILDENTKLYAQWEAIEVVSVELVAWESLNVYPNPTSDVFTIDGLEGGELLTIFDQSGRAVFNTVVKDAKEEISVSAMPAGTYFVRLTKGDAQTTVKLVIVK